MMYFLSGDAPFFFSEQMKALSWLPQVWFPEIGFGDNALSRLWLDYPFRLVVKLLSTLGLSWWTIEKLLWGSVIALAIYSSYSLSKLIVKDRIWSAVSSLIYMTNSYALLLFGGGQLGVALAYAFAPLVLLKFIESLSVVPVFRFRISILNGIYLAVLVMFDLRLAYLILAALVLYYVVYIVNRGEKIKTALNTLYTLFYSFFIPITVATFLHFYWVAPMIFGGSLSLSEQLTSPGMLKFLSVADFSHAMSLLHPNWPENLFGKVYILQPEFLLLPLLAFGSLLALRRNMRHETGNMRLIKYFALLSLIGVFFAKGVQEPFGGIYNWCFSYIPGFIMFRDPTKFYLFIALGYSILIPYTLQQYVGKIKSMFQKSAIKYAVALMFVLFWLITVRELPMGKLTGNFKPMGIPSEYIQFKNLLIADTGKSRVLWLPKSDKFTYFSPTHPGLAGRDQFPIPTDELFLRFIDSPGFKTALYEKGVKYIVVPVDIEKTIFMDDYRFNSRFREQLIMQLTLSGFSRMPEFQSLAVFVNPSFKFQAETPSYISRLEGLSRVGLFVSTGVFVLCILLLKITDKKKKRL